MSSRYDPAYEAFFHDTFDINAASDDTGVGDFNFSLDGSLGNTHYYGMQNDDALFEETHWHLSDQPYQRNDFQAAEITHGFGEGHDVGLQHSLDDSALFSGVVPAPSSAGVGKDLQLGRDDCPIDVFFLDIR